MDPSLKMELSMTERQVDVAVVILTCDQKDVTLRCLESFDDVKRDGVAILVWDNGSTDGTKRAIEEQFPDVQVRRSDQNLGVAGGRNAGASAAMELWNPEFLLFLDNDTVVTSGFIEDLIAPFRKYSDVGATTPKICYTDSPDVIDAAGGCRVTFWLGQTPPVGSGEVDRGQYEVQRDCIPGGCCMLVKTNVFRELQGFDEEYDPFLLQDIDFSLRVRDADYRCIYVPDAVIYHDETQTFEKGSYTQRYAYQKARNWYYFVERHANPIEKAGFWLVGVPWRLLSAAIREGRRGNIRAITGLLVGGWNDLTGRSEEQ